MGEILKAIDKHPQGKLKAADVDRMMITVNAGKSGPLNPANFLVRHQFLEFIIRCAIEKFFASGEVETELDAVKRMIEDHINVNCQDFD